MKASFNDGGGPGARSAGTPLAVHIEDAAMPSEIERLADLAGYLKVPPRPEWHLVKGSYRDMSKHTAPFVG